MDRQKHHLGAKAMTTSVTDDRPRKKTRPHVTYEQLTKYLRYDPDTGLFVWIKASGKGLVGKVAGTIREEGYLRIRLLGKTYGAHRLAWMYVNGEMPPDSIDHVNGIRDDNRYVNLRACNRAENGQNLLQPIGISGYRGVKMSHGRYQACISVNRKRYHLGTFDTPEQAQSAYLEAKQRLHIFNPTVRDLTARNNGIRNEA